MLSIINTVSDNPSFKTDSKLNQNMFTMFIVKFNEFQSYIPHLPWYALRLERPNGFFLLEKLQ